MAVFRGKLHSKLHLPVMVTPVAVRYGDSQQEEGLS